MTSEIYALRWKLAAALLALDPERDPCPDLAELRVAFSREQAGGLAREISDLLAERMALLDAERPGVTLIECVQGMLEATAQKPAASRGPLLEAVHVSGSMTADDVGHALWLCGYHPGDDPREVFKLAAARAAEWQEIEAATRQIAMAGPGAPLKVPAVVEKLLADRGRAEAAESRVSVLESEATALRDSEARAVKASMQAGEALKLAQQEAGHQRNRAEKLDGFFGQISAAYFAAGFGPSPTNAPAIASALGKARSCGDALFDLGWDGTGDPKAWAEKQAAQQSGCDVHAKLATATRDAKTRGDALRVLGWNGAEHPEAWAPRRARALDHTAALELLAPLRSAIDAMGTNIPARIVELAVQRVEGDARMAATRDKAAIHAKRWVQACKATGHDPDGEGLIANTKKAMEALVEPLRNATGYHATCAPAVLVSDAVACITRLKGETVALELSRAMKSSLATIRKALLDAGIGADAQTNVDLAHLAAQALAAHRRRAADLQALLDHERHMRAEADKDLVELTRPIWALMPGGAPRDIAPRGIIRQMVEMLATCAPALPSAGETE